MNAEQLGEVEDRWDEAKAAHFLGVSKPMLQEMCRQEALPFGQIGRKRFFFKSDLVEWLRAQVKKPAPKKPTLTVEKPKR